MPTQRIPLVLQSDIRSFANISSVKDQLLENCVFDAVKNDATRAQSIYVMGREPEGVAPFSVSGSGAATAVLSWSGKAAAAAAYARGATNSNLYTFDGSSTTDQGAITGQGIHISETVISLVSNIVLISDASSGRTWFYPDGGALTEITNVAFPPKQTPAIALTGNALHINGKMLVMTANPARMYESDINSLSSWGINNYLSLQKLPDSGVGLARYKDYAVAFGQKSTEFLKDVGNPSPGSSFVSEAFINTGCANQHAMVEWNDTVAFIGQTGTTGIGIYILDGFSAKKISPEWIDSVLATTIPSGAPRLYTKQSDGHQYLVISDGVSASREYWYHDNVGIWGMADLAAATFKTAPHGVYNLLAVSSGGIVANNPSARGNFRIRSNIFDFGTTKRKIINRAALVGQPCTPTGVLNFDLFRDYYASAVSRVLTFSTTVGSPFTYRLGSSRIFALDIRYTGSSPDTKTSGPKLQAADFDFEVCSA